MFILVNNALKLMSRLKNLHDSTTPQLMKTWKTIHKKQTTLNPKRLNPNPGTLGTKLSSSPTGAKKIQLSKIDHIFKTKKP